jgi:hypothetical protein
MPDLPSALEVARTVRGQHRARVQELLRDAAFARTNVSHLSTYLDELARADLIGEADRAALDEIITAVNIYLGAPKRDPGLDRLVDTLTTSYSQLLSRAEVSPVALAIAGTALDSAETAADEARARDDPDRGGGGEPPSGGGGGGVGVDTSTLVCDILGAGWAAYILGGIFGPLGGALGAFAGGVVASAVAAESRRLAGVPPD